MINKTIRYHLVAGAILATFFFIICTLVSNIAAPTHYTINKTTAVYTDYAYRIDTTKQLTLGQLLSEPEKLIHQPLDTIHWNLKEQNYWLLVKLENKQSTPVKMYVHFDNPMVDHLSIYRLNDKQQLLQTYKLGDQEPDLTLFHYSVPHIKLKLAAKSSEQLIIKVDTRGISKTPINIYRDKEFKDLIRSQTAIWGIFVGILVMAALYNLVLFYGIRDRVYLVYIGYILSAITLMGSVLGFGFYLWPLPVQLFLNEYIVFSNYAIAFFTVAFCTMFLRYHKDNSSVYKLSVGFLWLLTLLGITSFFIVEYIATKIFFSMMIVLYILCIYMIYKKLANGFRWAKFYIISWVPLIIGAAVQPLELTGVIAYSFATRHLFLIAILCEIVLMAMALADRVRYQRAKALYHATHTQQTELLNQAMLKQAYMQLNVSQRSATLCLIKVRHFNSLTSILSPSQQSDIIKMLAKALEKHLLQYRQFVNLEVDLDGSPKVADLSGGVLAFISTKSEPNDALQALLVKIIGRLPKRYSVLGLDLQLSYSSAIAQQLKHVGFDSWLQFGYINLSNDVKSDRGLSVMEPNLGLAVDLQNAIRNNQLATYYQPIINLKTNRVVGAESLLRWPDAKQPINIEELINLAERTGLINELTLWVIEQACIAITKLNKQGFSEHTISVNLSPKNLSITNFIEKIENALLKHNVAANQLQLELTETALIDQQSEMKEFIEQLSELGIKVILDDFGTGYSSLNYLLNYSFSTLKVDKSFVFGLPNSSKNQVIVKTAIEMAHNLDMKVTIEGVEDEATSCLLNKMNADHGQGYLYTHALSFDDYLEWLAKRN